MYVVAIVAIGGLVYVAMPTSHEEIVEPERLRVRVVREFTHSEDAFTQGLEWHDGHLYESTGGFGESTLRVVDLETGDVVRQRDLDDDIFAEGLTRVGDQLIQITWKNHKAIVWRVDNFERPVREFRYPGEGWGICHDGERLVMSDGSGELTFRDPENFEVIDVIPVRSAGRPVRHINELECVDGSVYANIWQQDRIVRIDPATGNVTAEIDASNLIDHRSRGDVLNGIAWIPERGHFVITGKLWPKLFEVEFVPASANEAAHHN